MGKKRVYDDCKVHSRVCWLKSVFLAVKTYIPIYARICTAVCVVGPHWYYSFLQLCTASGSLSSLMDQKMYCSDTTAWITSVMSLLGCPASILQVQLEREGQESWQTRYITCIYSNVTSKVYYHTFWMMHFGSLSAKRTCTWSNSPTLVESLVWRWITSCWTTDRMIKIVLEWGPWHFDQSRERVQDQD